MDISTAGTCVVKEESALSRGGQAEQTKGNWDKNRPLWYTKKKKRNKRGGETIT